MDQTDNAASLREDESDEEDAWLMNESMEAEVLSDPDRYKPQLMDEKEIKSLRISLRKSENCIESQGHLREYIPRKPLPGPVVIVRRPHQRHLSHDNQHPNALAAQVNPQQFTSPQKVDYSVALRQSRQQSKRMIHSSSDLQKKKK